MKPTTTIRWMMVSLIVAVGISAAWVPIVGILLSIVESASRQNVAVEQQMVTADGEPVVIRYTAQSYFSQQVVDLAGETQVIDSRELLQPMFMECQQTPTMSVPLSWTQRLMANSDPSTPPIYWYLLHDGRANGQAYGVGYHSVTRQLVAYFSRAGFSAEKPAREDWFNIEGQYGLQGRVPMTASQARVPLGSVSEQMIVLADGKLWGVDFDQRKVQTLVSVPGMQELGSMWRIPDNRPARAADDPAPQAAATTPSRLVVRGPESFSIVDRKGGVLLTVPLPKEARLGGLAIFELPKERFLLIHHDNDYQERNFFWIDAKGNLEEQKHLKLAQQSALFSNPVMKNVLVVAMTPNLIGLLTFFGIESSNTASPNDNPVTFSSIWPAGLIILVISTLAAFATYRRQTRFGLPHAPAWAAFSFVLGVSGWLAYRWHRVWPTLESCPACADSAPQDRPACAECGATFPPPALKGIEVYA